ncbi:MAG: hypothetical protein U0359_02550 [Byssovorax sp.]
MILAKADEPRARPRLRVAAEAMANKRVRVALERVADATDDTRLAEALAEIEDDEPKGATKGISPKVGWTSG